MITTAKITELESALAETNKQFGNNIIFKHIFQKTKNKVDFCLTVKSSKGMGGRISHSGRRVCAACYHAHFSIFENLFKINPFVSIQTMYAEYNCLDDLKNNEVGYKNIGSQCVPLSFENACNC